MKAFLGGLIGGFVGVVFGAIVLTILAFMSNAP